MPRLVIRNYIEVYCHGILTDLHVANEPQLTCPYRRTEGWSM
jgi:hypothetical protein